MQSFNTEAHTTYLHVVGRVSFLVTNGEFYANKVRVEGRVLAIIPDRFHRAAGHRFFTHRELFCIFRLLVDEGIVVLVAAGEVLGRGVATNVAVDTRGVHVKRTADVLFNFVVPIRQCQAMSGNFKRRICARALRVRHLFRFHQSIKLFPRQKTKLDSRVAQTNLLLVSILRYLGGFVVSNVRV